MTTNYENKFTTSDGRDIEIREFNAKDPKGRIIGAKAVAWNGEKDGHTAYFFQPQGMRGGFEYGAMQRTQVFYNEFQRSLAILNYFKGAEKRALRNFPILYRAYMVNVDVLNAQHSYVEQNTQEKATWLARERAIAEGRKNVTVVGNNVEFNGGVSL